MNKIWYQKLFYVFVILIPFAAIFGPAIENSFFQDDFLLLNISRTDYLADAIHFFNFIPGFPYRPLSIHFFYSIGQLLFGLDYQLWHAALFIWFGLNVWLVYRILDRLFDSKVLAWFGAFLYALSPIHYMTHFWIATFYFAQGTTFFLLGFLNWLDYRQDHKLVKFYLALLMYVLGILSNETVLVLPGIILAYELTLVSLKNKRFQLARHFLPLLAFGLIGIIMIVLRLRFAGVPQAEDYAMSFHPISVLKTTQWYFLRGLGLPEGIKFVRQSQQIYILAGLVYGLLAMIPLFQLKLLRKKKTVLPLIKFKFLGLAWFILGGMPFYLIPNHLSSYYMEISLIGLIILILCWISLAFQEKKLKGLVIGQLAVVSVLYSLLSFTSVGAMQETHWVSRRGQAAAELIPQIRGACFETDRGFLTIPIEPGQVGETRVVLHGDDAAQVICNDLNLRTKFLVQEKF